jgi:hypothetical protein
VNDALITTPEVLALLRCSRPTLERLVQRGVVNPIRLHARKLLYNRGEVLAAAKFPNGKQLTPSA